MDVVIIIKLRKMIPGDFYEKIDNVSLIIRIYMMNVIRRRMKYIVLNVALLAFILQ